MTVAAPARGTDVWLRRFPAWLRQAGRDEPDWARSSREEAMARFGEAGFPTSRLEEWKYTSLADAARTEWQPAHEAAPEAVAERVRGLAAESGKGALAVLLNGRCCPGLGDTSDLPAGVALMPLRAALQSRPDDVQAALAATSGIGGHALSDLNAAFWEDGLFLHIPEGRTIDDPVRLLFIHAGGDEPSAVMPRVVVSAGPGSQATLVEIHTGSGTGPRLSSGVSDITLGRGAVLHHVQVEVERPEATHVGLSRVRQERDSQYRSVTCSLGAGLSRTDPRVLLAEPGAACRLDGLYMVDGARHADHHTFVDHAVPHTDSSQLYRGVLDGSGHGVFFGRVLVRTDAQKISAEQVNNNLLLSDAAMAHSTPQLEIHADDVACRHASTIGQLEEEMLFYLRTRGIPAERARDVLTYAFAGAILQRVAVKPLRAALERRLFPEAAS